MSNPVIFTAIHAACFLILPYVYTLRYHEGLRKTILRLTSKKVLPVKTVDNTFFIMLGTALTVGAILNYLLIRLVV